MTRRPGTINQTHRCNISAQVDQLQEDWQHLRFTQNASPQFRCQAVASNKKSRNAHSLTSVSSAAVVQYLHTHHHQQKYATGVTAAATATSTTTTTTTEHAPALLARPHTQFKFTNSNRQQTKRRVPPNAPASLGARHHSFEAAVLVDQARGRLQTHTWDPGDAVNAVS
jgi:hypothetical protein